MFSQRPHVQILVQSTFNLSARAVVPGAHVKCPNGFDHWYVAIEGDPSSKSNASLRHTHVGVYVDKSGNMLMRTYTPWVAVVYNHFLEVNVA